MTYDYESVGARASQRLLDRIEKAYDSEPRCRIRIDGAGRSSFVSGRLFRFHPS